MELAVALWVAAISTLASHRPLPGAPGSRAPVAGLLPPHPGAGFRTTNSAMEECCLSEFPPPPTQGRWMNLLLGLNPGKSLTSNSSSVCLSAPVKGLIFSSGALWLFGSLCEISNNKGKRRRCLGEKTKDAERLFPSEEEEHFHRWGAGD